MKLRLLGWMLGLVVMGWCGTARADWTLTTADFAVKPKVTINEWSLKDGVSYTPESGKLENIATREVVGIASDRTKSPSNAKWVLLLRNGDSLRGEPAGMQGQALRFKIDELGIIEVPLRVIAALQAADANGAGKARAQAADKDVVRMKNGDLLEGVFVGLENDKIQMQGDNGDNAVALAGLETLSLGGVVPPRGLPALAVRVTFLSGSVLTSKTLRWTVNDLALSDPAGQEKKCAADQIVSVEVLGGRVVYLTELDPTKEDQVSTFGAKWLTAVNQNVTGGALKLAKTTFDRGLGVHTKSALTYALGGEFATLSLRCGVDDSASPYGEANLSIVLDGKVVWEAKGMKAGTASESLNLDVKGGKTLELRADPAGKMDVEGRVDWVNVALLRP